MILACLIVLAVLAVAVGAVAWRVWRPAPMDSLIRQHLLERYVVTIDAGETFTGLLAAVDDRTLILREVSVLMKDGSQSPVDGDIELRRDTVSYMQRPTS